MKRTILTLLLIAFSLLVVVSCASVPEYRPGGSLLVIPVENEYEDPEKIYGWYTIEIRNRVTGKVAFNGDIPREAGYILVRNLEPGGYYVSNTSFRYYPEFAGTSLDHSTMESPFMIREGEVSFTPMIFGQLNYTDEDGDFFMKRNFRADWTGETQEALYQELLDLFPEEMASWTITSFIGR
jgi:hypothetical protein